MNLYINSNRHIQHQVRNIEQGDWIYLENSLSRKRWSRYFKYNDIIESDLNITYITDKEFWDLVPENDMKFDSIVANPPYSSGQGNKLLYTDFFAKALELADEVAMIMPLNLNTNQTKLKAHNKLVIVHNKSISDDISDQFIGIGVGRISCVVASKHTMNEYVEVDNHSALNAIEDLFPQRVRMVSLKSTGNIQIGNIPIDPSVNVDLIHKVLKGDICVSDRMAFNEVAHKTQITNAPYVCLLNHTPSNGKFNVSIVKNDGTIAFGNWIFVIEAISEEEAICIKQHLRSDVVVKYVKRIMLALGSHTANKKIINKLPWYE